MGLHMYFWEDMVNTACHILKWMVIKPILEKTLDDLLKGRKPNISYFYVFGCRNFILKNGKDMLGS